MTMDSDLVLYIIRVALLCSYLVLVGILQRLDFLLVLVVLGVEGVNHLETGRE